MQNTIGKRSFSGIFAAISSARFFRSSEVVPAKVTSAPKPLAPSTFTLGAVVGIGAEVDDRCQVGALSLVPKFSRLKPDSTYVGAPVRELEEDEEGPLGLTSGGPKRAVALSR